MAFYPSGGTLAASGPAGGVLSGTYPNPGLTAGTLTTNSGINVQGNVDISTVGRGVQVAEGGGGTAKQGTFALAGAATTVVSNTSVTASSRILLTCQALGTVTTASTLAVSAKSAGASFTVTPSQATDTSTIAYEIFEPG